MVSLEEEKRQRQEEGQAVTEAEVGVMWLQPRNTEDCRPPPKLEGGRRVLPRVSGE